MQLIFEINHQHISRTDTNEVVADSKNYLTASFTFTGDEWTGLTKTAIFRKGELVKNQVLTDDACDVPWEVIKYGEFTVSVFGGDLITADVAHVGVKKSGYKLGETPQDPTPTVYQQILTMMENLHPEVNSEDMADAVAQYFTDNPIDAVTEDEMESYVSAAISALSIPSVNPVEKTADMTNPVGVDADGKLFSAAATQEQINTGVETYFEENPPEEDYRYQYVEGTVYPRYLYNWSTKTNAIGGNQYTSLYYALNGEKKIRYSGCNTGSTNKLAYCFVDESGNALSKAPLTANVQYFNEVVEVPDGATGVWLNGNNYASPHLEVAVEDKRADLKTLPYLLNNFGKRLQYKDTFAWKPMPTGIFAFTFDDSNEGTQTIVDTFATLGYPACFGTIPEKLNMSLSNGETVAQALTRAVANGCEILAHGSSGREIVTAANIDDLNFLYDKFVVNKQKFADHGFDVRGCVRVGGDGNICNDARTDVWVRMLFDYCDLYGISEPYNHPRVDDGGTLTAAKAVVDAHIAAKDFCPLLYHNLPSYINELVAYIIAQGGQIKTYAYAYDTYGTTVEKKAIEARISALETVGNGNGVEY